MEPVFLGLCAQVNTPNPSIVEKGYYLEAKKKPYF